VSEENVEIVRRSIAAFNRDDVEAMLADVHPEVEGLDDSHAPGGRMPGRSKTEVQRYFESFSRYWESVRLVPERFVDLGEDVLVLGRMTARTRRGGPRD
jgi:ketosteroid isomerase-like protein